MHRSCDFEILIQRIQIISKVSIALLLLTVDKEVQRLVLYQRRPSFIKFFDSILLQLADLLFELLIFAHYSLQLFIGLILVLFRFGYHLVYDVISLLFTFLVVIVFLDVSLKAKFAVYRKLETFIESIGTAHFPLLYLVIY
jgi:hypothetical protein